MKHKFSAAIQHPHCPPRVVRRDAEVRYVTPPAYRTDAWPGPERPHLMGEPGPPTRTHGPDLTPTGERPARQFPGLALLPKPVPAPAAGRSSPS